MQNIIVFHVVIAVNIILWYPERSSSLYFGEGNTLSSSPVDDIGVSSRPEAGTRRGEAGHGLTQGLDREGGRLGVQLVGVGGRGALVTRLVSLTSQRGRLGPEPLADVDNDEDTEEGGDDGDGDTDNKGGQARVGFTLNTFPDMIMDQKISSLTVGTGCGTVL